MLPRIGCCAFLVGRVGPLDGRTGLAGAAGFREGGAVGVGGVIEVDEGGGATLLSQRGRGGAGGVRPALPLGEGVAQAGSCRAPRLSAP